MTSTEYCLLYINWWPICMTKGEWASWAQAIGVVAALIVGIEIPRRQARRLKIVQEADYLRDRYALLAFKADVVQFVGPIYRSFEEGMDYRFDDTENMRLWQKIGYFESRLHDPSADRALSMLKSALREAVRFSKGYKREDAVKVLKEHLYKLSNFGFFPDRPNSVPEK